MSFGFDVLALLVLGGFYLSTRRSKPRRGGNRQPSQARARQPYQGLAKRPATGRKPAWAIEREQRAIAEGKRGEEAVQRTLHALQLPALHDIMLEDDKGPTQLDHLVRTPWGIAVLETKHYSGFIFGNPSGPMWTQRFSRGDETYDISIRSPVRQNYRHKKAVEHVVKGLNVCVKGFVVFSGNAKIGNTVKNSVVSLTDLDQTLRAVNEPRADPASLETAWEKLCRASIRAECRRGEHLAMVKSLATQQPDGHI